MARILTLDALRAAGASASNQAVFKEAFGQSVFVTEELCIGMSPVVDWGWAAAALLSEKGREKYTASTLPCWEQYVAATQPYWRELLVKDNPIRAGEQRERSSITDCWNRYYEAARPARLAYRKQAARIFAQIYETDGSLEER